MSDEAKPGMIHKAIIAVMRAIGPIAKSQKNTQQNFQYRGVEQVVNAAHPHFAENGVYSTSEITHSQHSQEKVTSGTKEQLICRSIIRMRFTFWAEDGSHVHTEVVGEGLDYGGDKSASKAMSAAEKYAICQLLKIPTAMVDPDADDRQPPPSRNGSAPTSTPRSQRELSPEDVSGLKSQWMKERQGSNGKDWANFVQRVCKRDFQVLNPANWTRDEFERVKHAVEIATV